MATEPHHKPPFCSRSLFCTQAAAATRQSPPRLPVAHYQISRAPGTVSPTLRGGTGAASLFFFSPIHALPSSPHGCSLLSTPSPTPGPPFKLPIETLWEVWATPSLRFLFWEKSVHYPDSAPERKVQVLAYPQSRTLLLSKNREERERPHVH